MISGTLFSSRYFLPEVENTVCSNEIKHHMISLISVNPRSSAPPCPTRFVAGMSYHTLKAQVHCCWCALCQIKMNFQSFLLGFYFVMFSATPLSCSASVFICSGFDRYSFVSSLYCCSIQCFCVPYSSCRYILQSKTMFLNIHFRMNECKMFRLKCVPVHLMNFCGFCHLRVSRSLWISSFLLACCCIQVLNF
jgi:hypothetical protein